MVRFCHDDLGVKPTFARAYSYDLKAHEQDALTNAPEVRRSLEEALAQALSYGWDDTAQNVSTILVDLARPLDGKGPCYFPYYAVAVSWDGRLSPCCLYYDYQFGAGQLGEKGFMSLWNGPVFGVFRRALAERRGTLPICRTCPLCDVSIHNMMHSLSRVPVLGRFAGRPYAYIDRSIGQ